MRKLALPVILLFACAATASAQTAGEPKGIALADLGYARTFDDEGLLGTGAALSFGMGWRVTPRLTIQGVFDNRRRVGGSLPIPCAARSSDRSKPHAAPVDTRRRLPSR